MRACHARAGSRSAGSALDCSRPAPPTRRRPCSSCTATRARRTTSTTLIDKTGELGRALAFDMPGFGEADDPPADFEVHVGSYSNFIQQALEELGIERVHLVLHDFGGPFGMLWGLQHPDAWRSTVLLNIGIMPGYSWHMTARRWRTPVLGELLMAWIPRSALAAPLPGRARPQAAARVHRRDVRQLRPRHPQGRAQALPRHARSGRGSQAGGRRHRPAAQADAGRLGHVRTRSSRGSSPTARASSSTSSGW